MPWELYGAPGSIMVEGVRREGVAWLRDQHHRKVVFHALPQRGEFDPYSSRPPATEEFVLDEDLFRASARDVKAAR